MSNGPVDYVAKTPVCLQIGDAATNSLRPGVCVTDIVFPNGKPIKIQKISFKNYYTAFLSLRLLRSEEEGQDGAKWVTCLRNFPLMANPHDEAGSQDYFSVSRQQVRGISFPLTQYMPLPSLKLCCFHFMYLPIVA
ncbi:hypothetical protein ACEWY4_013883 [Coilia grayii]|uniref:Uncharacterized protein n=1 Tax=Coilia grayii TaxID=363190 RepID=A0ABD1JXR4_9TELE